MDTTNKKAETETASVPEKAAVLEKVFDIAGNKRKLAGLLGISAQAVGKWARVPHDRVLEIERVLDGKVSRNELRPDLYPPE